MSILSILNETKAALAMTCSETAMGREMLDVLEGLDISGHGLCPVQGHVPAHEALLDEAILQITDPRFAGLKNALSAALHHLHWRVDDGGYYAHGADVGAGYAAGNMHALLVGPQTCPIKADDFLVGLFLLAPRTLYRDHKHLAPEVYLPLTGPQGWRFGPTEWQDYEAGHVICNAPGAAHATRVYDTPFLAIFAWLRDTSAPCSVIPADDWDEIETQLASNAVRSL